MPTNNATTFLKHSLYWLLPVILLNVFSSAGLQASGTALPFQVQTEQRCELGQTSVSPFLVLASKIAKLVAGSHWIGLEMRSLQSKGLITLPGVSVHPTANNLRRFYGKAAPEALDAWRRL